MNPEPLPDASTTHRVPLPVQAPPTPPDTPALVERLILQFGAQWVDERGFDAWAAQGGEQVLLFTGDTSRFPEGLDVAVVLPELQKHFGQRFRLGVAPRAAEERLARRFGSQRWPTLVFLRQGEYVDAISGMLDWEVFVEQVQAILDKPTRRAPGVGIPLVAAADAAGPSCH